MGSDAPSSTVVTALVDLADRQQTKVKVSAPYVRRMSNPMRTNGVDVVLAAGHRVTFASKRDLLVAHKEVCATQRLPIASVNPTRDVV
jgi:hypothetical protein